MSLSEKIIHNIAYNDSIMLARDVKECFKDIMEDVKKKIKNYGIFNDIINERAGKELI